MLLGQAVCRPVVILAIGLSLLLSGCSSTSQSELDKAKAAGASEEAARQSASAQQEAQATLSAEVQKLQQQLAAKTATAAPSPSAQAQPAQPQGTSCGANVSAGSNTTCPFALNVAAEYLSQGGGTISIVVYSPVTGQNYTMNCVAGVPSVCRGGNNAVVFIR
jgi:Flp pilus assembly protein TadG